MSPKLRAASLAAISVCVIAAAVEAVPSFALGASSVTPVITGTAQNIPVSEDANPVIAPVEPSAPEIDSVEKTLSLAAMVEAQDTQSALSKEEECLAGTVYFESKSETLEGQYAVAEVVINRSRSGRFPASICGVVYQPSQFSFVRGGRMPAINRDGAAWREAVAISRIAMADKWDSAAPNALFFHATHVSPKWRLKRVATIGNHVFYR